MAKVPMTAKDFEKVLEEVKELKRKFETALKDEQDAVKMYSEIFRLADRIEPTTYGKMVADIKKQETQHVESLRKMIQNADRRISDSEIMIKSLKKVEEEDREYWKEQGRKGRR